MLGYNKSTYTNNDLLQKYDKSDFISQVINFKTDPGNSPYYANPILFETQLD